jgi:outer membrane protein OmpA-like peptidoglycan-associated protein
MTARQAVQIAEDARAIAVKRQDDDLLAAERQAGVAREASAKDATARAQNARARAEDATANAQSETARVARQAAAARLSAQAEADRLKRDNDAKTAAALADADRLKRENDLRAATAESTADRLKQDSDAKLAAAQTEADGLRRENDAQKSAAQAELDRLAREKGQLETDKSELRAQLLLQFNTILQTRDTARGLIVNMSDVLFDTAKFTLRPEAREKLAKVAGIVSGHPGLRLDVEGHTDSVGGDDYNQQLSEERGGSVRDYLIEQGMNRTSVSSKGFGKTQPVASNETASGRQQNRRVELVISGEVIGSVIGVPIALR